jgi:N-acyl-phosphatidylethanolamine-hydrolysing phospholipase D
MPRATLPDHHAPGGGFRNPWPNAGQPVFTGMLRWAMTRTVKPRIDRTKRGQFPKAEPSFASPRAGPTEVSLTWVGHATFLIQIAGLNVLTDPVWSERCSPVQFAGPRRYMPPGIPFEQLPPIDLVLQTHDHYDHLDDLTVRRLADEHPEALWFAPLRLGAWLTERGARVERELDWWESTECHGLEVTSIPAQHFSGRSFQRNQSLWCGWVVRGGHRNVYFVGDTGRHPAFGEIGSRAGPFDAVIAPIAAYDPRWFMAPVHIGPEEAVAAYRELTASGNGGRRCPMVAMHWGTFKLTDEPMTEPPVRARAAWQQAGLPSDDLWILKHGETRELKRNPIAATRV